jgi:hypothetical protein
MSPPPQPRSDFTFPWSVDHDPRNELVEKLEQFYRLCRLRWRFIAAIRRAARPELGRLGHAFDQTIFAGALIVVPKALAGWEALRPVLRAQARALLPFIPQATAEDEAIARDPAWRSSPTSKPLRRISRTRLRGISRCCGIISKRPSAA